MGRTGGMGLEISHAKKLRKESPNSHMNLCVVAATQRITESQKDTAMLEELFSEYTGLTSLTGKQVKSQKMSVIINHILLKFHDNNFEDFIRLS